MKKLILSSALFLTTLVSVTAMAQQNQFVRPKTMGPANVPVVFVSPRTVKTTGAGTATYYKAKAILKWGTRVYETGFMVFACRPGVVRCQAVDFRPFASYEMCRINDEGARCFKRLTPSGNATVDTNSGTASPYSESNTGSASPYSDSYDGAHRPGPAFQEHNYLDTPRDQRNYLDEQGTPVY